MELRIKKIRKAKGLTQQELTERVGVTRRIIGSWESGKTPIHLDDAERVSSALGCSIPELINGGMSPQQSEYNRCWELCGSSAQEVLLAFARFMVKLCQKGARLLSRAKDRLSTRARNGGTRRKTLLARRPPQLAGGLPDPRAPAPAQSV